MMRPPKSENRKHTRIVYGASVDFTADTHTYIVLLKNLSLGGAFIAGDQLPPIEKEKIVSLSIPRADKLGAIELSGTVRRVTDNGIGIEFF